MLPQANSHMSGTAMMHLINAGEKKNGKSKQKLNISNFSPPFQETDCERLELVCPPHATSSTLSEATEENGSVISI